MVIPIVWNREGDKYYSAKVGVWSIDLHKANKYWVSNFIWKKRIIKRNMLTVVGDVDFAKAWVDDQFREFLDSDFCLYFMRDY